MEHGTHRAYNTLKCRCPVCRAFHNNYVNAHRGGRTTSEVEQSPAAPLDAGRKEPPPSSFRPATHLCDHCGEGFLSRQARGRHVAAEHPFTRIPPSYTPEPGGWVELPGDQWSAA